MCCLHLVLDSHLATLWESNCPFGFLLVMFPLGSSYFMFVFLSLWCLWWEVWDNCIDSWSLPSLLFCQNFWASMVIITKTCLYKFDPLKPQFYIVKLGFTGVYIIFLISAQNIDCGYSLEPPRRGSSNEYPQSMFWAEIWKNIIVFIWKF